MSEAGKIEALKLSRTRERSKATKSLNKLKALYQASDANPDELAYLIHVNEKQLATLEQLEVELMRFEVHDDSSHISDLEEVIFKSKRLLERLEKKSVAQESYTKVPRKFKLELNLPKYGGDLLSWPEFWELYTAAVHQNTSYSSIEKFVYLRGHLTGEAARSIQGLATTEENYQIAIDILKDRFGKESIRKEMLMANLLQLQEVTDANDLQSLQCLIDDLVANIRSLEALGTTSANYGELLLPILKSRIPESWRLQWVRFRRMACGSRESEFSLFVRYLQDEIRTRKEASQVSSIPAEPSSAGIFNTVLMRSATGPSSAERSPVSDEKGNLPELPLKESKKGMRCVCHGCRTSKRHPNRAPRRSEPYQWKTREVRRRRKLTEPSRMT